MVTAYPAALDTVGSQLRTDIASTDDLDDSGKEHDTQHVNVNGAVVALETKLGIGASAASAASDGDALTKQADGSTAWEAVAAGVSWSGSTANGLATYGSASTIVAESTATYDGTTLQLTTAGGGLKLDNLSSADVNTLDDYEEGTCTIAILCASGTIDSTATFAYTKVGRLVTIGGQHINGAVTTPSGNTKISGLPFATMSGATARPVGNAVIGGYSGSVTHSLALVSGESETTAWIYEAQGVIQGERWQASTESQYTLTYQTSA